MRTLRRKLGRELWHMRWQALAIALVMAAGVALVVMSLSALRSLEETRDAFYRQTRFGDLFVHLKRAPRSMLGRLREVAGVIGVEGRIVQTATLDVPGLAEPATGRLISLPPSGVPAVGRLHLRQGRWLDARRPDEALVSEAFASAHRFQPGDSLVAILNGRRQRLRIAGIVLSPEFIYSVRPGELIPDDQRFGVLWLGEEALASAYDLDEAFNDATFALTPGTSLAAARQRVDELLRPYGGADAYDRTLQPSHRFLENELVQLRTMALVPPVIFLLVTMFLLHIVLSRFVALQREQIATMRAFGYTRREIRRHYIAFALIIGLAGALLGIGVGAWLGYDLTRLYARFFRFPGFHYELGWSATLAAVLAGLAACVLGVLQSARRAAREAPGLAMQPEAPPAYRPSWLERAGLRAWLSVPSRMALRHLERRPLRAALTSIGIAFSIGILVMGSFIEDTVDHVMRFQFFVAQRYDLLVSYVEPTDGRATRALGRLPGVLAVEPFRAVPARLSRGHRERRLEVLGLSATAALMRPRDPQRGPLLLPEDGLVISSRLATMLDCRRGERLRIEVLEGKRRVCEVPVREIVDDYLDLNAYMELAALRRLLGEQQTVSGAFLQVDPLRADEVYRTLKATPRVAGASVKRVAIENYRRTMAENLLRMRAINVVFAMIVAVGVVYNSSRISLAEHLRELATLRVLGFTRRETAIILWIELACLVAAAIPMGMAVGYVLAWLMTAALNTEVHRFPLVIRPTTYAFAAFVAVVAALGSGWLARRRLDQFDLVEVLKARD